MVERAGRTFKDSMKINKECSFSRIRPSKFFNKLSQHQSTFNKKYIITKSNIFNESDKVWVKHQTQEILEKGFLFYFLITTKYQSEWAFSYLAIVNCIIKRKIVHKFNPRITRQDSFSQVMLNTDTKTK